MPSILLGIFLFNATIGEALLSLWFATSHVEMLRSLRLDFRPRRNNKQPLGKSEAEAFSEGSFFEFRSLFSNSRNIFHLGNFEVSNLFFTLILIPIFLLRDSEITR